MLAALLTASACGATAGGDEQGGSGSVTAEDFPARYAATLCALTSRCCASSGGTQLDACQMTEEEKQHQDAALARRSGARFNVDAAEACLADLESRTSCDVGALNLLADFLPDCRVWRGQAALGEACEIERDCLAEGDESVRCIDGACSLHEQVFPGSDCDPQSMTVVCAAAFSTCDAESMTCVELPTGGQSCSGDCRIGYICQAGECQLEAGSAGSDCTAANECQNGICAEGRCASMLVGSYCAFSE